MKGDREQRRVVFRRLLAIKEDVGCVPNEAVNAAANMLGLTTRQVRRVLAQGGDEDPREPFDLTERMVDYLFAARGDASKAHRMLTAARTPPPVGVRQFQRAVDERVDQALRAGARNGLDGVMAATVYLGRAVTHRNDVWAIDHTPAPIVVRPRRRGLQPYIPWTTTLMDHAHGMWMSATVMNSDPTAADTAAVVAKGIAGFTLRDGTFVGGLPDVLLSDRGGDLVSDQLTAGLAKVLVSRRYTMPGSPYQNGRVERMQGLWQTEWVTGLPGYLFGGRFSYQRKLNASLADPEALLFEDQFAALLAQEIERWNEERLSKGSTPARRWAQDSTPLRQADPEALRLAMLRDDKQRVVHKGNIEFDRLLYTMPVFAGMNGQKVDVRYLPGVPDFVEVYRDGRHLGQALLRDNLSLEQRGRVVATRRKQNETFRRHLVQGEDVNVEVTNARLRSLGYAEEDLPRTAGTDRTGDDRPADGPMPGQGDLLAALDGLNASADEAVSTAAATERIAVAVPADDLEALARVLGAPVPGRPGRRDDVDGTASAGGAA